MDKIEKIRQEIERRRQAIRVLNEHTAPEQTSKTCAIFQYSDTILSEILSFIDTLETETTYDLQQYTPRPSVGIEDVARVQFASHAKVFDKKRKAVFDWEQFKEVVGIFYGFGKKDFPEIKEKEQPSESLEEAAIEYATDTIPLTDEVYIDARIKAAFIAGAEWQVEQFEKNRITACDKQTKEEYDREVDFATGIIEKEHRNPTFSDAINYGIKWQKEQMLKEAVEADVNTYEDLAAGKSWAEFVVEMPTDTLGDKVRIIIVKEENK